MLQCATRKDVVDALLLAKNYRDLQELKSPFQECKEALHALPHTLQPCTSCSVSPVSRVSCGLHQHFSLSNEAGIVANGRDCDGIEVLIAAPSDPSHTETRMGWACPSGVGPFPEPTPYDTTVVGKCRSFSQDYSTYRGMFSEGNFCVYRSLHYGAGSDPGVHVRRET